MRALDIDNRIVDLMTHFVTEVKAFNTIDRTDINRVAQNVLVPIFAEVYGYKNLRNLDTGAVTNFPGIDLADDEAKVAIQVLQPRVLKKLNIRYVSSLRIDRSLEDLLIRNTNVDSRQASITEIFVAYND